MTSLYTDTPLEESFNVGEMSTEIKQKDLLSSELFELKNLWFVYNKKIN